MTDEERAAELHYAVRRAANILDHKLTVEEAHAQAMRLVTKMHLVWEAAHEVDKAFGKPDHSERDRAITMLRMVLDTPLSATKTETTR